MKPAAARLAWPALVWFSAFILAPVAIILAVSFAQRGPWGGIEWHFTLENYERLFRPEIGLILWQSVRLAAMTALSCTVLGTLAAWAMATAPGRYRALMLGLIALPFLTNLVIRVYALKLFVGVDGPLQGLLTLLGVEYDPFAFTANAALVWYGMVTSYLPFAVLPLYGALERFDFTQVEAAQDLGAGPLRILWSVILPGLKTAAVGAFILVFIPCLGEYVIPDLLGGAQNMLLGNLITEQFLKARHWPFGAAISVFLILLLMVALGAQVLLTREKRQGGRP